MGGQSSHILSRDEDTTEASGWSTFGVSALLLFLAIAVAITSRFTVDKIYNILTTISGHLRRIDRFFGITDIRLVQIYNHLDGKIYRRLGRILDWFQDTYLRLGDIYCLFQHTYLCLTKIPDFFRQILYLVGNILPVLREILLVLRQILSVLHEIRDLFRKSLTPGQETRRPPRAILHEYSVPEVARGPEPSGSGQS